MCQSGTKKRGFLEGGFCKVDASLGCGALSAKCTAGATILGYFLSPWPWHWTLQKPPLLKPPFLVSWVKNAFFVVHQSLHFSPKQGPKCCFSLVKQPNMRAPDRSNGRDFIQYRGWGLVQFWADPGVLWKKAPRAMRAMRGKTLETVPFQPYFGCTKSFLKVLSN